MLLLGAGCAMSTPIIADKAPCSQLVPVAWRAGVSGAPAPATLDQATFVNPLAYSDALAREWMKFGVAQTAQLTIANGRMEDAIGIVERCEARDAAAVRAARPKLLGLIPR